MRSGIAARCVGMRAVAEWLVRHGPVKGGASTSGIMRDVCARAPARGGAQQSCAGRVGVAGAVEEHVEGVLEWGVVAAAELVVVGGRRTCFGMRRGPNQ